MWLLDDGHARRMTPPQRVLGRLWTLERRGEVLTCVIVAAGDQEELRVVKGDDDIYLSELHPSRPDILRRSDRVRLDHEYAGWVRRLTPGWGTTAEAARRDQR